MEVIYAIAILVGAILSIILFFKVWGLCNDVRTIKTYMLDSNKIWEMCNDVRTIKKHLVKSASQNDSKQSSSVGDEEVVGDGTPKFTVNQLVIVKQDESQFRISSITDQGYYSEKHNKYFAENQIEDFDKYWKSKK